MKITELFQSKKNRGNNMSSTVFKAKYGNHTITYEIKSYMLKSEFELTIDNNYCDHKILGIAKNSEINVRYVDLQGTFVDNGNDYIVLVRLQTSFSDLMQQVPVLYINNCEVPLIKTN